MPPARKPAKSRSKRARARRSPVPWPPRLPVFEQRHLDLIGLGLVAAGVFLAFPLYLRWEGGEAGQAIVDGLTWGIGRVAWATPVALVAAGALLVMRPALPAGVRPFRAGALCLLGARPAWAWRWARWASGRAPARRSPSAAGTSARSWPTPARACSPRSAPTSWPSSCSAPLCCCSPARPSPGCCGPPASRWSRRRAPCAPRRARVTSPSVIPTRRSPCCRPTSRTRRSSSVP